MRAIFCTDDLQYPQIRGECNRIGRYILLYACATGSEPPTEHAVRIKPITDDAEGMDFIIIILIYNLCILQLMYVRHCVLTICSSYRYKG